MMQHYKVPRMPIFEVFILFSLSVLIWLGFYFYYQSQFGGPSISFPKNKDLIIDFKIKSRIASSINVKEDLKHFISGRLRGKASHLRKDVSYELKFEKFNIKDSQGRSIFAFKKEHPQSFHYFIDPFFSDDFKKKVFSAFSVDTASNKANEDRSLMQESLYVALNPLLEVKEFFLSPRLREKMQDLSRRTILGFLGSQLLDSKIPAFFPNKKISQWESEGFFLTPMKFEYSLQKVSPYLWNCVASSRYEEKSSPKREETALPEKYFLQNFKITKNTWNFFYSYRPHEQSINYFKTSLNLCLEQKYLGETKNWNYLFEVDLNPKFEQAEQIIADPFL